MEAIDILGLIAAGLTTFAFLPQLIKVIKTKSVEDISLSMYIVFITGLALWLVYGFIIKNLPIIFANVITISLSLTIVVLKIKYSKKN